MLTSWLTNRLLGYICAKYIALPTPDPSLTSLLAAVTCLGAVLSLFFALVETTWAGETLVKEGNRIREVKPFPYLLLAILIALLAALTLINVGVRCRAFPPSFSQWFAGGRWFLVAAFVVLLSAHAGALIAGLRLTSSSVPQRGQGGAAADRKRSAGKHLSIVFLWIVWVFATSVALYKAYEDGGGTSLETFSSGAILIGLLICFAFAVLEWRRGGGSNRRTLVLLCAVYAVLVLLLVFNAMPDASVQEAVRGYKRLMLGQTALGLIGVLMTWEVAFGWMADPNVLSLHLFYKVRLVRAYLGASNLRRGEKGKQITEAEEEDDVRLCELQNCERGAPYHLINTTLNLVGGRDLVTAQRSSDYFTLSKRYCGSMRTGYRPTKDYMRGSLTLGTAVAVSGAAASPNMGAMTLSASLAMLMTFLNVRLGFWAPTPNKHAWREPSARLWPFYTLRELLSQTNDLSSYCYLTDGGHFDNTGLYALVARGCRFIVIADCGADSRPCFQDLGTAIRRCHIDFGSEITLNLGKLERDEDKENKPGATFIVGTIKYNQKHLRTLVPREPDAENKSEHDEWDEKYGGWMRETREGVIVIIKPALTGAKLESADVRQYGLENGQFPQQSTIDLWYDEAQFESYRRLGQLSSEHAFGAIKKREDANSPRHKPDGVDARAESEVESFFRQLSLKYDERSPYQKPDHA